MKRYLIFLLCGLLSIPSVIFAKDGVDSLDLTQTILTHKYKNYSGISGAMGLSGFKDSKVKKTWFRAMRYSGWARFYPYYRNMQTYYDITPTQGLTLPVNVTANDGYQQPLMLLRLEANPSAKTWFQTELQFDNQMLRNSTVVDPKSDPSGKLASLYVIFRLEGSVETRFGKYKMIAGGGANWYRLSPFTLWGYQYRDDMFERYPWEPEGLDFNRYNSYYTSGDVPRDQRFGMQGTQGFILEGTNLPKGFDAALLYGKTSFGPFQTYLTRDPYNMFAARVGKTLGNHKIGYSYFDQFGSRYNRVNYVPVAQGTDTFYVDGNYQSQLVTTLDGRFNFDKFSIFIEGGAGSYLSNTYNAGLRENAKTGLDNLSRYKRDWDETMFMEISTKKRLTYLPLRVQLYRIGKNVVNNTSSVVNTSVEQAKPSPDTPDEYYTNYFAGMVTEVGQLANNRQGINLFTNKDFFYNKIKVKLDLGIAQEIVNLAYDMRNGGRTTFVSGVGADSIDENKVPYNNSITYEHRLNGLTRSRFAFYKRFQGPYGRLHSIFRRNFENIAITDTIVDYKKSFNTFDLELKYKFKLFGKEIIVSNFNNVTSVQDHWSVIPVWSDKAFLRYFYEELMVFYSLHPKVSILGFWGYERALGNHRTEVADANGDLIKNANGRPVADPNGKPINQTGHGYGCGLDYNFHGRASLNYRTRWFDHKDKNFIRDQFKGNEMTVELKVFF